MKIFRKIFKNNVKSKPSTEASRFFLEASEKEQEKVFDKIMEKANEDQRKIFEKHNKAK